MPATSEILPVLERGEIGRRRNGVLAEMAALQGRITAV